MKMVSNTLWNSQVQNKSKVAIEHEGELFAKVPRRPDRVIRFNNVFPECCFSAAMKNDLIIKVYIPLNWFLVSTWPTLKNENLLFFW